MSNIGLVPGCQKSSGLFIKKKQNKQNQNKNTKQNNQKNQTKHNNPLHS